MDVKHEQAFTVTAETAGVALAAFLADRLGLSKRNAKALVDTRNVFVNRRRVWMARHALKAGDTVEVTHSPGRSKPAAAAPLYEDDGYLVVNKPPGLLSNGDDDSLERRLRQDRREPDLQCVHRLDRDTSGCLLLARSEAAFEAAVGLFREHTVRKVYRAIVLGFVEPRDMTLTQPVDGQRAVSHVRVLDANRDASHVAVTIETGRTHQIRKHLAGAHHPVVGDRYYAARTRASDKSMRVGRQMLHAYALELANPVTAQRIRARAALPGDFRRVLKLFRLT